MKFACISVDPPWQYNDGGYGGGVGTDSVYSTMPLEDLRDMAGWIDTLVENNCWMFMWVTNPFMEEGHWLMRKWGFDPKTLITWIKIRKQPERGLLGVQAMPKIRTVGGHYTHGATEHIILGVRGSMRPSEVGIPNVFFAPVHQHSFKPDCTYRLIERLVGPDVNKIELFARRHVEGWYGWGNQYPHAATLIECPTGKQWEIKDRTIPEVVECDLCGEEVESPKEGKRLQLCNECKGE